MSDNRWQIIIAGSGWVYVGKVGREEDKIVIRDCFNIRRWGTARGLGELALEGPKTGTELDFYGTLRLHVLGAVGGELECSDAVWDAWFAKRAEPAAAPKPGERR